jgi:hypothetical protein
MKNPYHEPETASAIWNVAMNGGLRSPHRKQLLALIADCQLSFPVGPEQIVRSLEIVLSRVKAHDQLRRDLMSSLTTERGNAARRAAYRGAGDLSAGLPNRTDPERRGFDPC